MKLVTWNTQWCKGLDDVVSPNRIIEGARAMADFDVLCLQEIAVNYPQLTGASAADQPQAIADLLPGYEVVFGAAIDERSNGVSHQFGTVIASRLPILQVQRIMLPSPCEDVAPHAWMPRICTIATIAASWGPVRVMTTHLEYHSLTKRQAQAKALRGWHQEACSQARFPALVTNNENDTPYQTKPNTLDAVLCGDFNFEVDSAEYRDLTDSSAPEPFLDSWTIASPNQAHPPTFRLYDDTYGPESVSCDFFFVSESLAGRVGRVEVDTLTKASDHQPVLLELLS